ncbi:hypothetical protein LOY97_000243 [Ophidiomyces ophidiicola]|nr:hypothetical protein LOZ49_005476 [Ophidiomyces ophidiicola]KAI2022435.1 hypothetical protein LOZ46_001918 [Ophidiomyces ophidiicola]KAI2143383.1 hypothetical protein LOZ29_001141 [Ophidiomyces ophidiicola]KAI2146099.1 hypothetical protein LOZ28_000903 [Ophidiomyces ophidiicola]KAI2224248.1 hypothetical protein LOZ15_000803 [Ophidiomyces ophidiicola]
MSAESLPISPVAFAAAIKDLTIPSLYAKVSELRNSITHLERSIVALKEYVESLSDGDEVCEDAITENETVIQRMLERIDLVKAEVETRGQQWIELDGTRSPKPNGAEANVEEDDVGFIITDATPQPGQPANASASPARMNEVSQQSPEGSRTEGNCDEASMDPEEGIYL